MIDLLKKTLLTGVGLVALTKDKVEEMARDIAKSAQMSAEKGEEFVQEAVTRAEKTRADFDKAVQNAVNDALSRTNVATKDDIAGLMQRIEQLEGRLSE